MILHALNRYYQRKCADPDPAQRLPAFGFEQKEIPFLLEINTRGELVPVGCMCSNTKANWAMPTPMRCLSAFKSASVKVGMKMQCVLLMHIL